MKRRSDEPDIPHGPVWERLVGLGERSIRKSYFPELQERMAEIDRMRGLLAAIIDSMPSILIAIDADGLITQWNKHAAQVTGVQADAALGRPVMQALPLLEAYRDMIEAALQGRQPQTAERIRYPLQDALIYYDIAVYPLLDDDRRGAVIRIDDVTYRARIEEVMVQTEKMMSVGGLAAGMAHEINNPLGGILNAAQNIRRRTSQDLTQNVKIAKECGLDLERLNCYLERRGIFDMLGIIRESGERASRIVSNMLSFSRRSESSKSPTDLAELITNTIELASRDYDLKKKYDFRHIRVETYIDPNLPPTPCSQTEIEQVLLNLLKNSAQAMAEKTYAEERPTISVRATLFNEWAKIEIADNGPGMTPEILKRVFEPFFTTKEVGVGTGLGLSVSYFIITKNHGGRLTAQSSSGLGTTFTILLPLK